MRKARSNVSVVIKGIDLLLFEEMGTYMQETILSAVQTDFTLNTCIRERASFLRVVFTLRPHLSPSCVCPCLHVQPVSHVLCGYFLILWIIGVCCCACLKDVVIEWALRSPEESNSLTCIFVFAPLSISSLSESSRSWLKIAFQSWVHRVSFTCWNTLLPLVHSLRVWWKCSNCRIPYKLYTFFCSTKICEYFSLAQFWGDFAQRALYLLVDRSVFISYEFCML